MSRTPARAATADPAARSRSADRTWSIGEMRQRESTALSEWISAGLACVTCLQEPVSGSPHEAEFAAGRDRYLQMSDVSLAKAQALDRLLSMMVRTPAGRLGAVDDGTYVELSLRLQGAREAFYDQRHHLQEALHERAAAEARHPVVVVVEEGAVREVLSAAPVSVILIDSAVEDADPQSVREVPRVASADETMPARVEDFPATVDARRVQEVQALLDAAPALLVAGP